MSPEQRVVALDDERGVGSLSEAIALAIQDAYAGIVFEDPTFERGTDAVMTALRERSVEIETEWGWRSLRNPGLVMAPLSEEGARRSASGPADVELIQRQVGLWKVVQS